MTYSAPGVCETTHAYAPRTPALARSPDRVLELTTGIIGRTTSMRMVREQLVPFAKTTATVVIRGETGTGKELVARALHALSPRAKHPFIAANVAAINESLLQSELFGHERGAFTGAYARHRGLFEQAHNSTLFLDEVAELTHEAQVSLLRVLETREVRPVGAEHMRRVDVRLVVATHRNLGQMVRRGHFRTDLYYRLATLLVELPPLRHRTADLPLLASHLLAQLAPEVGPRTLDADAVQALGEYGWPGNVRQLANVLRRVAITTQAPVLTREHISAALAYELDAEREIRDGATTATIAHVLEAAHGNISRAARRLGIARSTLRSRMRRAGLAPAG